MEFPVEPLSFHAVFVFDRRQGSDKIKTSILERVKIELGKSFGKAGACFDLLNGRHLEYYKGFIELAAKNWPDKPWGAIPFTHFFGLEAIGAGADREKIRTIISNVIGRIFGGMAIYNLTPETGWPCDIKSI